LSFALFFSFLPLLLVWSFNIWLPTATIWETFGVHYSALPMRTSGEYCFIGNAMFFTEFYAYLPSYFVHFGLHHASDFDKFQIYALLVLALHGCVASCVFAVVLKKHFSVRDKICLLACGILPSYLQTEYINFLQINYMMVTPLFYVWGLYLLIAQKNKTLTMTTGRVVALAFISALIVGTKINYVVLVIPFLVAVMLQAATNRPQRLQWSLLYGVSATIFFFGLLWLYLVGNFSYLRIFCVQMCTQYTSSWTYQQVTHLVPHVRNWVVWESGFQEMAMLAGAALVYALISTFQQASRLTSACLGLTVSVSVLQIWFLTHRTAGNTFCDVIAFLTFAVCMTASSIFSAPTRVGRLGGAGLILGLAAIALIQTFAVFDAAHWLPTLTRVSKKCREIQQVIEANNDLPIVYYIDFAPDLNYMKVMFPSVFTYGGYEENKSTYLRRFQPGSSYRSTVDGVMPAPHVMIVPEYFSVPEDTFLPGVSVEIFTPGSSFERERLNRKNEVTVWELERGLTDFRMFGSSTVTVIVKR
jgi:hypothetical protein